MAPFSFFTGCSIVPPMVCFASERRADERKDTIANIEDSREFVVNIASAGLAQQVVATAQDLAPDVSEVAEAALHLAESRVVGVPRVEEAPVSTECTLHQITMHGTSPHSLVIGHVVAFHVREDVYDNGRISFDHLDPLGWLAGDWYITTRDRITVPRLDKKKGYY